MAAYGLVSAPLLAAALAAAGPQGAPVPVLPEHMALADSVEREIRSQANRPPPPGASWFAILRGKSPIVVTAPHAAKPMRNGKRRFADRGTGALAVLLHEVAGATAIYSEWACPCDANITDDCAFKDSLAGLIKEINPIMVLDLHASGAERPYDIDFGTMGGLSLKADPSLLEPLAESLAKAGLAVQSTDFFKGEKHATVTKFAAARGVPAVQLEINAIWLRPEGDDAEKRRFAQALNGLATAMQAIERSGKRPAAAAGKVVGR